MYIKYQEGALFPSAYSAFTADPTPIGVTLTIRERGDIEVTLHLTKTEAWALVGHLAPAAMHAGDGSNLD